MVGPPSVHIKSTDCSSLIFVHNLNLEVVKTQRANHLFIIDNKSLIAL